MAELPERKWNLGKLNTDQNTTVSSESTSARMLWEFFSGKGRSGHEPHAAWRKRALRLSLELGSLVSNQQSQRCPLFDPRWEGRSFPLPSGSVTGGMQIKWTKRLAEKRNLITYIQEFTEKCDTRRLLEFGALCHLTGRGEDTGTVGKQVAFWKGKWALGE